ncbi:hypothetical protein GWI33_013161 [Rhynchophorus ferrugineus]|uniref:Uncharacterized protein n=1 Tax=Rhynchophorus ferrugineus TaxID=354439 RepID=A0A834IA94_RHYFE|nr:hypothetical protein GWI33_013161 [Rhynchophorus ferrugineus]
MLKNELPQLNFTKSFDQSRPISLDASKIEDFCSYCLYFTSGYYLQEGKYISICNNTMRYGKKGGKCSMENVAVATRTTWTE